MPEHSHQSETSSPPWPARLVLVCFFACSLIVTAFGSAQSDSADAGASDSAGAALSDPRQFSESFDAYARRYRDAKASGDPEQIARMLETIKALRVERSVFQLHDVANGFVVHALADLEAGRVDDARASLALARELDPTIPTAVWSMALSPDLGGGSSLSLGLQGWLAATRSLSNRDFVLAGWLSLFLGAAFAVAAVFAGCLLYRYAILIAHDLEERLPDLDPDLVPVLTAGVLLLPLILTFGVLWLVPFWMAVTYGYQTRAERVITVASLVLLALLGPAVSYQTQWARASVNPVYRASLSSLSGTFEPGGLLTLENASFDYPDSRDLAMLLATQYKNLGEYESAALLYRSLLDKDMSDLEARLSLGNIYFAQRDWDGAVAQYALAIELAPSDARAWYNKALAHGENFQFGERETAHREAEAHDAELLAAHEQRTGSMTGPISPQLTWFGLQQRFLGLSEGLHSSESPPNWTLSLVSGRGLRFLIGTLVFAMLIVLLEFMVRDRHLTQRCWKCTSAFCGRCQIGTGRRGLCTQCYHLFHMKDGVSIEARNRKLQQVDSTQKRQGLVFRILSLLMPGAGHLTQGATLLGILFVGIWLFSVFALVRGTGYALPDDVLGLKTTATLFGLFAMLVSLVGANLIRPRVSRR